RISEITLLWMCGPSSRQVAHAAGVYKWNDPKCTPELLNVRGDNTKAILQKILDINRPCKRFSRNLKPIKIENNDEDWQIRKEIEFFVDFETYNDIFTDFSSMPNVNTGSM